MSPPQIAVLDTDDAVHRTLQPVLATRGYDVVAHASAADALPFIRQHQPILVIAELHVEYVDSGLDVVRALRDDPTTADIPILMVSADPDLTYRMASIAAPLVFALPKQVDVALLLAAVDHLLALGRGLIP
jgi:CheY-like chemotaxis protein